MLPTRSLARSQRAVGTLSALALAAACGGGDVDFDRAALVDQVVAETGLDAGVAGCIVDDGADRLGEDRFADVAAGADDAEGTAAVAEIVATCVADADDGPSPDDTTAAETQPSDSQPSETLPPETLPSETLPPDEPPASTGGGGLVLGTLLAPADLAGWLDQVLAAVTARDAGTTLDLLGAPDLVVAPEAGPLLEVDLELDGDEEGTEVEWDWSVEATSPLPELVGPDGESRGSPADEFIATTYADVLVDFELQNTASNNDPDTGEPIDFQVYYRPVTDVPLTVGGIEGTVGVLGFQVDPDVVLGGDGPDVPGYDLGVEGRFAVGELPVPVLAGLVDALDLPAADARVLSGFVQPRPDQREVALVVELTYPAAARDAVLAAVGVGGSAYDGATVFAGAVAGGRLDDAVEPTGADDGEESFPIVLAQRWGGTIRVSAPDGDGRITVSVSVSPSPDDPELPLPS